MNLKGNFLTLLLLLICSIQLWAQKNAQGEKFPISGIVTDEQDIFVPYASIALYSSKDSTFVGGTVTDTKGKFTIHANAGNYYLKITFLSFEEKVIQNIELQNAELNIGKLLLKSRSIGLGEVEIRGEKNQMQLQVDKRVFQVGKDLSNIGGNAAEVLDNVPSVSVNIEGNITLRGSQNVRILIDGKPSGLTGKRSAEALRKLQANMIESVEIITNPSARHEAEGEVGIINIVLVKEKDSGMNGSFEVYSGFPDNYGTSYNLNFRRRSINLFSSY